MKTLLPVIAALLLQACASTQPISQFQPVSLTSPRQHVEQTQTHIKQSQTAAQKLADECAQKSAGWQDAYNLLNDELTKAYLAAQIAKDELTTKQTEIDKQTAVANTVVVERNKAVAQVTAEHQRGNKWMKYSFLEGLVILAAVAWLTKGIWLKALLALMLMVSVAQGNIGDTPEQFKAHFKASEFGVKDQTPMVDYIVTVKNRDFFCYAGFKNGKSVIETWISNPPSAGIPGDIVVKLVSPYGKPEDFTVVDDEGERVGLVSKDERIFVVLGRVSGFEQVTISDAAFIKAESQKKYLYYVKPPMPDGDEEEEPAHIISRV